MQKLVKFDQKFNDSNRAVSAENEKSRPADDSATTNKENNGGADGTRTRDLQRDRLKLRVPDKA